MAPLTGAARTKAYRDRKALARVELQLSPVTKERLLQAYHAYGSSWDAFIVSLLPSVTGDTAPEPVQLTGKARADKLLSVTGDNIKAALELLKQELQVIYPDWHPSCSKHKAGTPLYEPQRIYNGVAQHFKRHR